MRIAGFYQELWPATFGSAQGKVADLTDESPLPDEEQIGQYLRDGHEIFSVMGVADDVLGSDARLLGGDSIRTDGDWVWREDLWFYLHTYHVQLPDEFLTTVRERNYSVPQVQRSLLAELGQEFAEKI